MRSSRGSSSITITLGFITTQLYDLAGQPKAIINPLLYRTTFGFDNAGRQVRTQNARGYIASTIYDKANRTIATVDPLLHRATTVYDAAGRVVVRVNPLGARSTFGYDAASNLVFSDDPLGNYHVYYFDVGNRRYKVLNDLGYVTTTVYDNANRIVAQIDPLGNRTTFSYDRNSRQIRVQNPLGFIGTSVYDAAGRLVAQVDPLLNRSSMVYDAASHLVASVNPLGFRQTTVYDAADRAIASIDPLLNHSTIVYDNAGLPIAAQNALGFRVTNVYDGLGQRIALQDARGNRNTFAYDGVGNMIHRTDPLGRITTSIFDAANRWQARLDPRLVRTTFLYDAADQNIGKRYSTMAPVTFAFDAVGNRILMNDSTGRTTYSYDNLYRTKTVVSPGPNRISYAYDAADRRTLMIGPDGGRFTYAYDNASRITSLINPQAERTTFGYDATHRTSIRRANGARTSFSYDAADRVVTIVHSKSDGSIISRFDYRYDKADNRLGVTEADGVQVTWSYDKAYQLLHEQRSGTSAYNITHVYDPAGNRLLKNDTGSRTTYTFDAANQMSTMNLAGTSYTTGYDAAGNLATVVSAPFQRFTLAWDAENRLVTFKPFAIVQGVTTTHSYNGDHLRVERDYTSTTKFIWDMANVLTETDGTGAVQAVYTLEPAGYGNLISARRSGATNYHVFDALGSTDRLLDASQGEITRYIYDAFGGTRNSPTGTNPFRWVGMLGYYYDGTFLIEVYIRRREYSTTFGRFDSEDPEGVRVGDENLYLYVVNNATNSADPSGLKQVCGFYVWLYTGLGWCVEENVYQAALDAAAQVVTCWWNCEVTTHKCVAGKILTATEVVTGSISAAGARVPKNFMKFLTGFGRISPRSGFFGSTPYTSISRVLGNQIGAGELGKAFGRSTIVAGAKGAFVVTAVVEAGISITCGWKCSQ